MTSQFMHDCDVCQFLGEYEWCGDRYDLYYCPRCDEGSVIARYGSEGSEYKSVPVAVLLYAGYRSEHPLLEAMRRQIKRWQHPVPSWSPANLWRR